MRHFCQVIRGEAQPLLDGRGGTRTLETTLAVETAARTGEIIRTVRTAAQLVRARREATRARPAARLCLSGHDSMRGMAFVTACSLSYQDKGAWTALP